MESLYFTKFVPDIGKAIDICTENGHFVCTRCILRYCNTKKLFMYLNNEKLVSEINEICTKNEMNQLNCNKLLNSSNQICNSCLNLLNDEFIYEKANQIAKLLSQKQLKNFQLHISLPVILTLRNHYFLKRFDLGKIDFISTKELFRVLLADKLKNILQVEYKLDSSLVIELNFNHNLANEECDQLIHLSPNNFYQKKCCKSMVKSFINHSSILRGINELDDDIFNQFKLTDIRECCNLQDIIIRNEPVFIAGRYLKFSRVLSQTPWLVNGEALYNSSVQDEIVDGISKYIQFKTVKFSSSGREDVDVQMLGRGRPFLIEITNPVLCYNDDDTINKIKESINSKKDVNVNDLQFVDKYQSQLFLKEGEQNKKKTYQALCCINRKFTDDDLKIINSTENLKIIQKTPVRVLHRRTLSDRTRTIHKLWAERVDLNELDDRFKPFVENIIKLNLITEAGTYIKEFVHSDFSRTIPNLCSLLGSNCCADIIHLDVMEIDLDWPPAIDS